MLLLSSMLSMVVAGATVNQTRPRDPYEGLKCHYAACHKPKEGHLNIHIISHTHDDVGWVHTVDHYYEYNVKYILDSVIEELQKDPERRFIYVEMAFFTKWWNEQTAIIQNIVRDLVHSGRLEFISGGWSMSDEAATHYSALIDEMTIGTRWLNDTFGACGRPKIGWQIDSFGHSTEQAAIFRKMGFDGMYLGRIHYEEKEWREEHQEMEMLWQTDPTQGKEGQIFVGVLPNVYWPPKGFCFDMYCNDEEVTNNNGRRRAQELLAIARNQARNYQTNNTVFTMGLDFHYQDANKWFRNLDKLIYYINQEPGVNAFYSTPSCYTKALYDSKKVWSVHKDDFFPYADGPHAYWTGYFTSRPNFKFFSREQNGFLQACRQLEVFGRTRSNQKHMDLARALGVIQHHDGISGTEKQHVVEDYVRMTLVGTKQCEAQMSEAFQNLLDPDSDSTLVRFSFCPWLNVSACDVSEKAKDYYLIVYNPYTKPLKTYARLPVEHAGYQVLEQPRRAVPLQMVPVDDGTIRIPERRSVARQSLVFPIQAPPMGARVYKVEAVEGGVRDSGDSVLLPVDLDEYSIENEFYKLIVDPTKGLISTVVLKRLNTQMPFRQSIWKYYAYQYSMNWSVEKPSGAYAFNPFEDNPTDMAHNVPFRVVKGALVEEIHQVFDSWATQVIRLYRNEDRIEFDWTVGPIPFYDDRGSFGKEIILRFESNLINRGEFYTDSNGRQDIKRIRNNPRPWHQNLTEPIASNYYPVVSWIHLQDKRRNIQMTMVPDRPMGGSSLKDGMLELMVHRRLQYDDGFGVEEPLDELGVDRQGLIAKGKIYVTFDEIARAQRRMKHLANRQVYRPVLSFLRLFADGQHVAEMRNPIFMGITRSLPDSIHILTVEPLDNRQLLVRIEYMHDSGPPVTIDLSRLFTTIQVYAAEETVLSANQYLGDSVPFHWYSKEPVEPKTQPAETELQKVLLPGDIRTFLLTTSY
ncbi:lysosomal alpha-mannosidase-like isoform X2 [Varroa jacobsoni]|uniref:Alpha-mannosidase n=1 Tax=Varroa destructor TaxID=109461 RepID=A0A7M7JG24_VARDE|nr:lysosomal alpha-mannosidase-like isoform X1 [Varroa destructor]XP_022651219.1 lysosomal alpha-mannosidase-like isoform X1 [Varroa destructor]XP_022711580.1 lysosomal alpha-mannosidase-like isoform X2 [Varroa jacobsoni]